MILSIRDTRGSTARGTDGDIGKITDVYFDDDRWVIRYLVVKTGEWLKGRAILISPASIGQARWAENIIQTQLKRDQVKNAPDIDTAQPISRRLEREFSRYYQLPIYWGGNATWGTGMTPGALAAASITGEGLEEKEREIETGEGEEESHLRSADVVIGYNIHARDGDIGRVADFLFDDQTFRINYMVIDTSSLFSGKKVTLPPSWVTKVDWTEKHVYMNLNRETIRNSPDFDLAALNRDAQATAEAKR